MSAPTLNTIAVYPSDAFVVTDGVAEGDGIAFMDELVLDDVYQLSGQTKPRTLTYEVTDGSAFVVGPNSAAGTPGNLLFLDCCITLMAPTAPPMRRLLL